MNLVGHFQHSKLYLMAHYLKTGDLKEVASETGIWILLAEGNFDWLMWLDCDSLIMSHDRTLDSIIAKYTQLPSPLGNEKVQ